MRRSAALIAALAVLTACAGSSSPTADDSGPEPTGGAAATGAIDFVLSADAEEVKGYQEMVAAFTEQTGIDVTLTPFAERSELTARLTTGLAGSDPPDVFLVNWRTYGQFVASGGVEAIEPYLDSSDALSADDFYSAPFDAFRYDGEELSCMPQNASSLVVYYNADMFEDAGLEPPTDGWTWDDFVAAGKALTKPEEDVYGIGVPAQLIRLAPFVWSNGGELTDDATRPTKLTLQDGPAREALDFFLDLSLKHKVVPPDAAEQSQPMEERFLAGKLGMLLSSRVDVPLLRTISDFEWDAGPLPAPADGEVVTELHTDAYCLAANSDAKDTAWRFIEFAESAEGQTILTESGRIVPSRKDIAESPVFGEPELPPANSQVYLDNLERARVSPTIGSWPLVEEAGDQTLEDTFYGRVPRQDGIDRLHAETDALFEQVPSG